MVKLKTNELKLGDVVQVFDGPWNTAIVQKVTDDIVTFYRPYGHANDFSTTSGVICYTGLEQYQVYRTCETVWNVWERGNVK